MQKPHVKATVTLLVDPTGRVCLARKKQPIHHDKNKGGEDIAYSLGMHNGYGGKQEPEDEDIYCTAIRELYGESRTRTTVENLELVQRVSFWKPHNETREMIPFMEVSFFLCCVWEGEPEEGDEMGPAEWFLPEEIPYHNMMPADRHIFERIFSGKRSVLEIRLLGKDIAPEILELDEALLPA